MFISVMLLVANSSIVVCQHLLPCPLTSKKKKKKKEETKIHNSSV